MAVVRFATTYDSCGDRSEEYTAWPLCRECGRHFCSVCQVPQSFLPGDGEGPDTCLCPSCLEDCL